MTDADLEWLLAQLTQVLEQSRVENTPEQSLPEVQDEDSSESCGESEQSNQGA